MKKSAPLASAGEFESRIVTIRGRRVILDADLAAIYGVSTKRAIVEVLRRLIDLLDPPPGEVGTEKELGFHVNMKNDPARGRG